MKTKLLLFCLLLSAGLQAQYFHKRYGQPADADFLTDGASGLTGHLLTGTSVVAGFQDLIVTRTNVNGDVSSIPDFNRIYRLSLSSGPLDAVPVKIIQMGNGRILVVGNATPRVASNQTEGIFSIVLLPNGTVSSARFWTNISLARNMQAVSACLGTLDRVFITGEVDLINAFPGAGKGTFILAINGSTNVKIWGRFYDIANNPASLDESPADIIFSPYNTNNLVVAGTIGDFLSATLPTRSGFTFRVNANTGGLIGNANVYDLGDDDEISAITIDSSLTGGFRGFVISGTTGNLPFGLQPDYWAFKINNTGTTVAWSNTYEYSAGPTANTSTDVMARKNTLNQWTFFLTGYVVLSPGDIGILTLRLDATGNSTEEFVYNTPGNQVCVELGAFTNTTYDGLSMYSTTDNGSSSPSASDMYLVKSYYNGASGCNEAFAVPVVTAAPVVVTSRPIAAASDINPIVLTVTPTLIPTVMVDCFNATIGTGSNAREADPVLAEAPVVLSGAYPNPVDAASGLITLQLQTAAATSVQATVFDLSGRVVMQDVLLLGEGEQQQTLQLPAGTQAGIYILHLTADGHTQTLRFVVN